MKVLNMSSKSIVNFTFILLLVSSIFFLFTPIVIVSIYKSKNRKMSSNIEYEKYKILKYDSISNRTSSGFVTLKKGSVESFLSYEYSNGKHTLISDFESDGYKCTGSCFCDSIEEGTTNRRSPIRIIQMKRGLVYLVAAITSLLAYKKAKSHFEKKCEDLLRRDCYSLDSNIRSEVDGCDEDIDFYEDDDDDDGVDLSDIDLSSIDLESLDLDDDDDDDIDLSDVDEEESSSSSSPEDYRKYWTQEIPAGWDNDREYIHKEDFDDVFEKDEPDVYRRPRTPNDDLEDDYSSYEERQITSAFERENYQKDKIGRFLFRCQGNCFPNQNLKRPEAVRASYRIKCEKMLVGGYSFAWELDDSLMIDKTASLFDLKRDEYDEVRLNFQSMVLNRMCRKMGEREIPVVTKDYPQGTKRMYKLCTGYNPEREYGNMFSNFQEEDDADRLGEGVVNPTIRCERTNQALNRDILPNDLFRDALDRWKKSIG